MDAEGIELLEPSTTRSRCVSLTNPFRRRLQPTESLTEDCNDASSRLRVVYDCQFERFFLREDTSTSLHQKPTPHQKPRVVELRPEARPKPSQRVQWEDLILPPRSATKGNTLREVSADPIGISDPQSSHDDAPRICLGDGSQPSIDPSLAAVTHTSGYLLTDPRSDTNGLADDQGASKAPESSIEAPVIDASACGVASVCAQLSQDQQPPPKVMLGPEESTVTQTLGSTTASTAVTPTVRLPGSSPSTKLIKFEAAVVLLRSLLRFHRERRGLGARHLVMTDPIAKPESAKHDVTAADAVDAAATLVSSDLNAPPAVSNLPDKPEPQQAAVGLRLDFSAITAPDTTAAKKTVSPSKKSPLKKTRISSYAAHFAKATTPCTSSAMVEFDQTDEKEVRWHGEILHIGVEIPKSDRGKQPRDGDRDHRRRHMQEREPITHIYNLRELIRIRPTGDGFRRVNESCKFAELTSSSESESESESDSEEEIATRQIVSSGEDEGPHNEFKRGDRVLFYTQHRWFKGTVLRRIKASWFYDIRAANGTVFEAIQTRNMRVFDGVEEKSKATKYEIGDRVLWRPRIDTERQAVAKRQNYKAKIKRVRRKEQGDERAYDVELRTGRLIKKVPSDQLCLQNRGAVRSPCEPSSEH